MTIGMSTETEICQIRGRFSQDLRTSERYRQAGGGKVETREVKRHLVQITYGLTH